MKYYLIFIFIISFSFTSCREKNTPLQEVKKSVKLKIVNEKSIIERINDTLTKKIDLNSFIDSITNQKNVKVIEKLNEVWNEKNKLYEYNGNKFNFKLSIEGVEKGLNTNSVFIDGKNRFSFKNYKVLGYKDEKFESENFGFNNQNSLENSKIIEIANKKFLYSDISFICNGIGCGCQLNFIYDIELRKPFFIDNYRFPFDKFYLSDFNNDKVIDLIIISRGIERISKELRVEQNRFRVSWFEYKNGTFIERKNNKKEKTYFEFISYTQSFNHGEAENCQYSILKENWK